MVKVASLVEHAVANVPFYRSLARDSICSTSISITDLPLISKEQVKAAGNSIIALGVEPSELRVVRTGGTTGEPAEFFRDPHDTERESASVWAAWSRFGISSEDRVVVLVGRPVGAGGEFRAAPKSGQLWLGGARLSEDVLARHYERIVAFEPALIRGYPSALSLLAQFILRNGLAAPRGLRVTGSSSEILLSRHRQVLENAFGGLPHVNLYGQAEHVALASSCLSSSALHVDEKYGYVELVDQTGRPIDRPGVMGEVVATGLGNRAAPLIRYRTGDRASWSADVCLCGEPGLRFASVEGRVREVVVDHEGRPFTFGPWFYGVLSSLSGIKMIQFHHERLGELLLKVVLDHSRSLGIDDIHQAVKHVSGFSFTIVLVDEVDRTAAGKVPLLVIPSLPLSATESSI